MKIFNTKKLQEEWQKKVEESYNQGKKDTEKEFNNLLNAVTKDKEYWNSLSEKELLIEMMLALKFNNNNVENLNNKILYIQKYKDIFKELNYNMDSLKKTEDLLNLNIENEKNQIIEFENLIKNVMSKVNDIDSTLKEIIRAAFDYVCQCPKRAYSISTYDNAYAHGHSEMCQCPKRAYSISTRMRRISESISKVVSMP